MLKPIAPFVEYAINYDYISKVLCINKDKPKLSCNGKCQLMIKLQEQQQEDYQALTINLKDYPIGFVKLLKLNKKTDIVLNSNSNHFYQQNYKYSFSRVIFHPPAV